MPSPRPTCNELFGVTVLTSRHPDVRRLKRQHPTALHGNKSWSANYLLMDYLQDNPLESGQRLLDAGCGWGLVGIQCARYYQSQVLAVDADADVFPYLELHAEHNQVPIDTRQATFDQLDSELLADIDTLIAADVCFWDELADSVYGLIARACEAGVSKIILADPGRPPFWQVAELCAEHYYAEVEQRQIQTPRRCSGVIMVIENA